MIVLEKSSLYSSCEKEAFGKQKKKQKRDTNVSKWG